MEKKYCCTNPDCCGKDKEKFKMTLTLEGIMDEQNVAQMFCPHCKEPLVYCDGSEEKKTC